MCRLEKILLLINRKNIRGEKMDSLMNSQSKYETNLVNINNYVSYVGDLFFSLCETKQDLIEFLPTLYNSKTIDDISKNYDEIKTELYTKQKLINEEINSLQLDVRRDIELGINPYDATADGDLLLYLYLQIERGQTDREKLFSESQSILEALCITKGPLIHGERFYELYDNEEEVYKLIDIALNNSNAERKLNLQKDCASLDSICRTIELFNLNNLMNVYRQCFIQTMAYFDNCIFELFECCMKKDYFFWLNKFKNSSIKTHDMATFSTFETFRDSHISELLKNCYVKDLLLILKNVDSNIFCENGKDVFSEIQELIGKRNVHIHNNGIVDNSYIEGFNIYGKVEGEVLIIDEEVLQRTQQLTSYIVQEVVKMFV